jgi:type 1 glutamine amidotransferase
MMTTRLGTTRDDLRLSRERGSTLALASIVAVLTLACSPGSDPRAGVSAASPSAVAPIRVLMLTATTGFRHDSIAAARGVMANLSASSGDFSVTATEDLSALSPSALMAYDVLMFALTSGELPLSIDQRAAMLKFVASGGGFIGVHSASDTLYEWPEYGELVGAYVKEHPWTQQATVIVEDPSHPATAGLPDRFSILEEFYTFRENPRPRVQVLVRLDAESVGAAGDYPLAWSHSYGSGRAYYNALGHFSETWRDPRFQRQLAGAIRWAARRG